MSKPDRGSQSKVASWSLAPFKKKAIKYQQAASAGDQVHVVADAADVGTVRKQQPTAEERSGQKKRLGKVTGLFRQATPLRPSTGIAQELYTLWQFRLQHVCTVVSARLLSTRSSAHC